MATRLTPAEWRLHLARQFIESVDEVANSVYYVFVGNQTSSGTIPEVVDDVQETLTEAYSNMILGKRVRPVDVSLMVRRIDHEIGTTYAMYDDGDPVLSTKDYFVVVNAGSFSHVFKCLDNNANAASSVAPNFADVDPSDDIYQTGDGYRWKYMYSVDDITVEKFATTEYFPVVANSVVEEAAVPGTVSIVRVVEGGEGYNNHLSGTFAATDVRINGNGTVYALTSNASTTNGFYTGCVMYLAAGTGVGQHARVVDYFVNANGRYVILDGEFPVSPTNGTDYEVNPEVRVHGTGFTTQAVGRALVNTIANAIYRIEILEPGEGYTYAWAEALANSVVDVTEVASLRPVTSPAGGHGSDAASELGATRVAISVKLSNSESNTVPAVGSFRQVGIMKDPVFSNVDVTFETIDGTFLAGEDAALLTRRLVAQELTANVANVLVSGNSELFLHSRVVAGDWLYLESETDRQLALVADAPNSSHVALANSSAWTCTSANAWVATIEANVVVAGVDGPNATTFSAVSCVLRPGSEIVGYTSGARGTVATMSKNGTLKGFDTFVQCHKYVGTYDSGTFTPGETLYQRVPTGAGVFINATALLHSTGTDGANVVILTTNQHYQFSETELLLGANSGAVFTVASRYWPEVVHGSGRVIYLENTAAVTRQADQTEAINLIYEL